MIAADMNLRPVALNLPIALEGYLSWRRRWDDTTSTAIVSLNAARGVGDRLREGIRGRALREFAGSRRRSPHIRKRWPSFGKRQPAPRGQSTGQSRNSASRKIGPRALCTLKHLPDISAQRLAVTVGSASLPGRASWKFRRHYSHDLAERRRVHGFLRRDRSWPTIASLRGQMNQLLPG
jgi:hypothetical protein